VAPGRRRSHKGDEKDCYLHCPRESYRLFHNKKAEPTRKKPQASIFAEERGRCIRI